ncbi:MAG: hypothetical protein ACPG4T_02935 [Nannocystaceae bacterium]
MLTSKIGGPVTEIQFTVNGSPYPWPAGEDELEYIVDSSGANGTLHFELAVAGEDSSAVAAADVVVSLPASGTVKHRIVDATPSTSGNALAVVPGAGAEDDTVWVVGNAGHLLRFSRVQAGDLWTTTLADPMDVEAVAVDAEESLFVAGGLDGSLKVRRYRYLGGQWVSIWERVVPGAVAHDVKVGPDGFVYVAGEVHAEAALWVLTESGGTISHDSFAAESNGLPLTSAARAIAFEGERIVILGDLEADALDEPKRAALFTFEAATLKLRAHDTENPDVAVTSSWNGAVSTPTGLMGVGWVLTDGQPALARAQFSADLTSAAVALKAGHIGEGIFWHGPGGFEVVVGSKVDEDLNPTLFAQGGGAEYLDTDGVGYSVAVDRHGYTHVAGRVIEDGVSRLVLVTLHP